MRALLLSLVLATSASAATIPVTSPTDEVEANGLCSLREAVQAATTDAAVDACPAGESGVDRIEINPALGALALALGEIEIAGDVEIVSTGDPVVIDAQDGSRIFLIRSGTARLIGLALRNGFATDFGGCINATAGVSLTLRHTSVRDCAAHNGGGIAMVAATLHVEDSEIGSNLAQGVGGGLRLLQTDATFLRTGIGGNLAAGDGGNIHARFGTLVMTQVGVFFGLSDGDGGGMYLDQVDLTFSLGTIQSSVATYGGGFYADRSTVTLSDVDILTNTADQGGGMFAQPSSTVTMERGRVAFNQADSGAGLYAIASDLTLSETRVESNTAKLFGGGIAFARGTLHLRAAGLHANTAAQGGGAHLVLADALFEESLLDANSVLPSSVLPVGEARGGGIFVQEGTVAIRNSTLSGNATHRSSSGDPNADGGALHVRAGDVRLESVTIVDNTAVRDGGGISHEGGTLEIQNSILASNTASGTGADCKGEVVSMDHNLIQSTDGCTLTGETEASIFGVDPVLAPLTDNGGPTLTHLPEASSPAVDAGMTALVFDQRGYTRDAMPDIGAVERDAFPPLASEPETDEDALALHLAPNPSRSTARVTFTAEGEAKLALFDTRGRRLAVLFSGRTAGTQTVDADVRDLAPGVYLLRLTTSDGAASRALVVAR